MKKIFTHALFFITSTVFAQTTIPGGAVSGTWDLAGSPYIVQSAISISGDQTLTIDPGVEIRFLPETKIMVYGQLMAEGTAALPIIFHADDTVGWSNQATTAGGWSGLQFPAYAGTGTDHTTLDYCTVRDVKYGYSWSYPYTSAFTIERGIKLFNCTITHNNAGTGYYVAEGTMFMATYSINDTIYIDHCEISENTGVFGIIRSQNYFGGYTRITNSNIHDNHYGSGIWAVWNNDLLLENNEFHDNDMQYDNSPIKISIGSATVRGNKVYNNVCYDLAAVGCRSGKVTIENNLICNNRQTDATCGAAGGGGGIHLAFNEIGSTFEDTYYIVRNNIVANNYSAYGGGGIYVYNARATIANNDIVNNFTPSLGRSVLILSPSSEVYLKNNLFYAVSPEGVADTSQIVFILSAAILGMDYNYMPSTYSHAVYAASGFTFTGDTIHNVIGITPGMIAPTEDNDIETSALTANFNIAATSPCVNMGDTVGAYTSEVDYAGHNRIVGTIDIGAYEYGPTNSIVSNGNTEPHLLVYPDPATSDGFISVITPEASGIISIADMNGKIVLEENAASKYTVMHLKNISRGIYLVTFRGNERYTTTITVQ